MTDTLVSKSTSTPSAELIARSKLPFEGTTQLAYYGADFVARLRYAFEQGYTPRYGTDATTLVPAIDDIMTGLAALAAYSDLIEFLFIPGVMTVNGSNQVQKLFNFGHDKIEARLGTTGPLAVGASGGVYLDHSGGQGRGLRSYLRPDLFNVTTDGKALIHIGYEVAHPANGYVMRLRSGSVNYLTVGVTPGAATHEIIATRRIAGTLRTTTLTGANNSPLATWQTRIVYLDYATGTLQLDVNGVNQIAGTPGNWYSGDAGILDTATPTEVHIGGYTVPATWNTRTGPVCLLSDNDSVTAEAVAAVMEAHFAPYM